MSEFRRVHRATPLLQFWTAILAIFVALILNINASGIKGLKELLLGDATSLLWVAAAIAVFALFCVLVWWVSGVWWRAAGYRLGEEEVQIKHGVISKHLRTARYDRIQAVDVVEPVIARLFQVAKVRIETAGGSGSALEIVYLPKVEAAQVRAEVLARVRGEVPREGGVAEPEEDQDVLIPPIPVQRSIAAAVLHPATLLGALAVVLVSATPGGVGMALPVVVGLGPWLWNVIDRSWQFTATLHDDALHVTYGLADKRKQTVPLNRIHAVQMTRPLLWKKLGWWKVMVSVAGYGMLDKQAGTTTILPVGSREQAIAVVAALSTLEREELDTSVTPERAMAPTLASPETARWLSPVDFRNQTVTLLGDRAVVLHSGRFSRQMKVVEPSHIQELSVVRGPIASWVGLANVRLDLVPGPVFMSANQLSDGDAQQLVEILRQRKLPSMQPR